MTFLTTFSSFTFVIFIIIFLLISPFLINAILAESRGKSVPLILLLTLIFSWIVTLILAFTKKEKDVRIPKYFIPAVITCLIIAIIPAFLAGYADYTSQEYRLKSRSLTEGKETNSLTHQMPAPDLNQQADIGPQVNIEEFIVNIISGDSSHYVKASLTVELTNPEVKAEVEKTMPRIHEAIKLLIGNKTFEELQDLQGKKQLKAELTSKINSFLKTGKVKAVYFTNFAVK